MKHTHSPCVSVQMTADELDEFRREGDVPDTVSNRTLANALVDNIVARYLHVTYFGPGDIMAAVDEYTKEEAKGGKAT